MNKIENRRKLKFYERFIMTLLWPVYSIIIVSITTVALLALLLILLFKPIIRVNNEEVNTNE